MHGHFLSILKRPIGRLRFLSCFMLSFLLVVVSGKANAEMCQQAYEKQLADAIASKNNDLVSAFKTLPPLPVYNLQGQVICYVKVWGDLRGPEVVVKVDRVGDAMRNPQKYVIESGTVVENGVRKTIGLLEGTYDQAQHRWTAYGGDDLRDNEAAIARAKAPLRVKAVIDKVHAMDFSGIRIGQSLQQAFDTLLREGYRQTPESGDNENIYKMKYRYSVVCPTERVRVERAPNNTEELRVPICQIGPRTSNSLGRGMGFEKRDKNGNAFSLVLAFSVVPDIDRGDALKNARVIEINAELVMKAVVDRNYYETLANEKYGSKRADEVQREDRKTFKYASEYTCFSCIPMGFDIEATSGDIRVRISDGALGEEIYNALVISGLAKLQRSIPMVEKPKF